MVGMIILSDEDIDFSCSKSRSWQVAGLRCKPDLLDLKSCALNGSAIMKGPSPAQIPWAIVNCSELLLPQRQEFLNEERHPARAWHEGQGEAAGDDSSMETFTMATVWPCGFYPGQEISTSRICGVLGAGL